MSSFNDDWKKYRASVYPDGLIEEQNKQVYLAFHAGAVVMYARMLEAVAGRDPEEAIKAIERLKDEVFSRCEEFCNQIKQSN